MEALSEADNGGDSAAEDLESRKRELKQLSGSIKELTEKAQGIVNQPLVVC